MSKINPTDLKSITARHFPRDNKPVEADFSWLNFFCQILEQFLLTFRTNCPDGPRWGLTLPRIPPPTSVLYWAVTNPFRGYVHTQNTPNPTPKHPYSWPEFESAQNELQSGQNGPQLGKYLKSGKPFLKCAKKIYSLIFRSGEIMDRANAIIVCIMFGAWIWKIRRTSLQRFGTIR